MRTKVLIILAAGAALCVLPVMDAWGRGFGGFHAGGFHAGGFGGFHAGGFHAGDLGGFHASSFHAGGFGGGFGSVHYGGWNHASAAGWGGYHAGYTHVGAAGVSHVGYTGHDANYGSISHYDSAYHVPGDYGGGVYHGAYGGTAAAYHGPVVSGAAVKGPAGYGAAAVKGPAGGVYGGYRGPYSAGAVAHLPSGYTAAAWHGGTYYHSGYNFYEPHWYGGSVYYYPTAPPVGWFFAALPAAATAVTIAGTAYYEANGVYYQPSMQNGQVGYVVAQAPTGAPEAQMAAGGSAAPDPFQSLQQMSEYMGKQKHFLIEANETYDEMAFAGDKIQLASQRTIRVERPDKMSVEITNTTGDQRQIVFDGKDVTVVDKTKNTYGIIPVAGTLDAALDTLAQQYGMAQPGADLLYSDIYARLEPKIKTGQFLGVDPIAGKPCNHFAYTLASLSWQVWIEQGDKPVPRKLLMSYDSDPGRPQYSILVTRWDTGLEPGREFKARIPAGATKISIMSLEGQVAAAPQP